MRAIRTPALTFLLSAFFVCGCGGKYDTYPVSGKVTLSDGTPVDGVQVTFECREPALTAVAVTDEQGNYSLGTVGAADGAPAGEYRVTVVELPNDKDPDHPPPPRIHGRYRGFSRSGLEFTVEAGNDTFDIRLDPPDSASP